MGLVTDKKTALVTGVTAGAGFKAALGLAVHGAHVIITGREGRRGQNALAALRLEAGHVEVEFIAVDHSLVSANHKLARVVCNHVDHLDVLVNNVGGAFSSYELTAEGIEATLALNCIGPVALTEGLMPLLQQSASARIINVTAPPAHTTESDPLEGLGAENDYTAAGAYRQAQLFRLIWTLGLAKRLEGCGVSANAIAVAAGSTPTQAESATETLPGWRPLWPLTRLVPRLPSADKQARAVVWLALADDAASLTGRYLEGKKPKAAPRVATESKQLDRVWDAALALAAQTQNTAGA